MTFGEPASCRAAAVVPLHVARRRPHAGRPCGWRRRPRGTARRRRSQSARPASTPAAERRVQLVPGEGDPVHVQFRDVHGVVRGELSGVEDDAGAVRVRGGGQLAYGPQLAGDVRRPRDAHQRRARRVAVGERPLQRRDGLLR